MWWFTQGGAVTLAFLSAAVSNKYFQRMPNASQFLCGSLRSKFHTKTGCAFVTAEVGVRKPSLNLFFPVGGLQPIQSTVITRFTSNHEIGLQTYLVQPLPSNFPYFRQVAFSYRQYAQLLSNLGKCNWLIQAKLGGG
ncbi:hypothetical protein [Vibrio stylophorae]|uniref:hypothetical protein n=1 Tax=Vibrio stylophorae TaxID=659351 RepID=UPI001F1E4FCE|nr:hypothetical protein [Vibrio stylophorae]